MTKKTISVQELAEVIISSAGVGDGAVLGPDVMNVPLCDLGYDSLALLETIGRVQRDYGISLDEEPASPELTLAEFHAAIEAAASR